MSTDSAKSAKRPRGRPSKISKADILAAARTFPADEITMPAVANKLSVKTPSLYHHFRNREDLLSAMGKELAEKLVIKPGNPRYWRSSLITTATRMVQFLVDNPYLMTSTCVEGNTMLSLKVVENILSTLEKAGFTEDQSFDICDLVFVYIVAEARMQANQRQPNREEAEARFDNMLEVYRSTSPRFYRYAKAALPRSRKKRFQLKLRWALDLIPDPAQ